jgi:hypothetical protein
MASIDEALFAQFHANLASNLPDQHILENITTYNVVCKEKANSHDLR